MEQQLNEQEKVNILAEKWAALSFIGKEQYYLNDQMEITTIDLPHIGKRMITALQLSSFDTIIQNLLNRYAEIAKDINELDKEWALAADKTKLAGKIEKSKEYIAKAMVLGDLNTILTNLQEKNEAIAALYQTNSLIRAAIVQKATDLAHNTDWKNTTQAFKDILEEWKNAPVVPKESMDQLWNQIDSARNHFFDQKRKHQESFENEMMQNLDLKLELCELAEAIQESEQWKDTTQHYKDLVEKWKGIGRVASVEKNEELWKRFMNAQNYFFNRKKDNFESIQQEQQQNLQAKLQIIEKAKAISDSTDWKTTTQIYAQLSEEWKQIGRVPREDADNIWKAFQDAKDYFFNNKRIQFESHKLTLEDNYAKKSALLKRMEMLKNSRDWKEATDEINELMNDWKAVGPIPREYKDDLWEQFIAARNLFFNRKDEDRTNRKQQFFQRLDSRIEQTKDFLLKLEEQQQDEFQKLDEFKQNILKLDDNNAKDQSLKAHILQLIQQIEQKLPGRAAKIEDVKTQLAEILQKKEAQSSDSPAESDTLHN